MPLLPSSRRRVAFVTEHASPLALLGSVDAGGQNVYVDEVCRHLAALGWSVDIFTRKDSGRLPTVVEHAPNVRVVNIAAGPLRSISKDDLWPYMAEFRDGILGFAATRGIAYDMIHGNFWMSGWVASELARTWASPVVQIFHALGRTKRRHQGNADTSPRVRIRVEKDVINSVDRLIAQCPAELTELVDDYDASPERVSIIPSAVDVRLYSPVERTEARRRIGLETDGPVVAYVGRMLPRKDPRNIVRALGCLKESRQPLPVLIVVGGESRDPCSKSTPEIGELQELAANLGVSRNVIFFGSRQPWELRNYYSAADVVVTTPWYEPFGLTPLEAMACGRPVIGSAVGGIKFTIKDGETGYLVAPRNPSELAFRIRLILADADRLRGMGIAARKRVEGQFTWAQTASSTAGLYEELLKSASEHVHDRAPRTASIPSSGRPRRSPAAAERQTTGETSVLELTGKYDHGIH